MAIVTTAWKFGTTATDVVAGWTNPGRALTDNGSIALLDNVTTEASFYVDGFDFAVPAGAVIVGIQVQLGDTATTGAATLQAAISIGSGTQYSDPDGTLINPSGTYTRGRTTQRWGSMPSPLVSEINNLRLYLRGITDPFNQLQLDFVAARVHYMPAADTMATAWTGVATKSYAVGENGVAILTPIRVVDTGWVNASSYSGGGQITDVGASDYLAFMPAGMIPSSKATLLGVEVRYSGAINSSLLLTGIDIPVNLEVTPGTTNGFAVNVLSNSSTTGGRAYLPTMASGIISQAGMNDGFTVRLGGSVMIDADSSPPYASLGGTVQARLHYTTAIPMAMSWTGTASRTITLFEAKNMAIALSGTGVSTQNAVKNKVMATSWTGVATRAWAATRRRGYSTAWTGVGAVAPLLRKGVSGAMSWTGRGIATLPRPIANRRAALTMTGRAVASFLLRRPVYLAMSMTGRGFTLAGFSADVLQTILAGQGVATFNLARRRLMGFVAAATAAQGGVPRLAPARAGVTWTGRGRMFPSMTWTDVSTGIRYADLAFYPTLTATLWANHDYLLVNLSGDGILDAKLAARKNLATLWAMSAVSYLTLGVLRNNGITWAGTGTMTVGLFAVNFMAMSFITQVLAVFPRPKMIAGAGLKMETDGIMAATGRWTRAMFTLWTPQALMTADAKTLRGVSTTMQSSATMRATVTENVYDPSETVFIVPARDNAITVPARDYKIKV